MKSKRSLMTVLVGLAMLATPIAAAAKDHGRYVQNNWKAAHVSRQFNAPVRNFAPAVVVNKHQFRNGAAWMPAPVAVAPHGWKGRGPGNDGDADDYANYGRNYSYGNGNYGYGNGNYGNGGYGNNGYYAAPYGGGYAGGNNCRAAQSIVSNYYRDRNTGHPAAAASMLRQNPWAFRNGCTGNGSPYNGGLLGGLGGYGGAPAYGNYGGYNNGNNGGYGQGYGQPYGGTSMLAPLIQQFVR